MPYQIEPHAISARLRGKLLFLPAWLRLVIAMRRRRPTELWIGDSHAMGINRPVTNGMFMRGPDGMLVLRAGAKLMYSLARDGFPPRVMRVARFVHRFGRPGAFVPIFSAGDIDVRVHLPKRPEATFEFVERYVEQCLSVAELFKATKIGFLVPPPPVDARPEEVWFPITGTMDDRLAAQKRLVDALYEAAGKVPHAVLIDLTPVLSGPTGGMPVELTMDGAHTDAPTVERIRAHVAGYDLLGS